MARRRRIRRRSRQRTVGRRRRFRRLRRIGRRASKSGGLRSTLTTVANVLWGINNIAGPEISAASGIGGKITTGLSVVVARVTGLSLTPESAGIQQTINIGGMLNGQTLTGAVMWGIGRAARGRGIPGTGFLSSFGRKAISIGILSGLFSANPAPFNIGNSNNGTGTSLEVFN